MLNPSVRSIAANGIDDAREFFSSMIGKDVTSDSYTWDCTRVGNLTFKAVKNDENLYATIDIDVGVLPDVTQLRFVPAEVIDAAGAENSFSGKPYYSILVYSAYSLWLYRTNSVRLFARYCLYI